MLKVKTILKQSEIHGLGLFADEFIPKDTLIFEEDIFTIKITEFELELLPDIEKQFVNHYCYFKKGTFYCSIDNDRFTNHSENPNVYETETSTYALRDILPGEEILTDYKKLCENHDTLLNK